ncbi:MAG TPA: hypothetical protein VN256_16735 [Pyrinomonadaceae bacterium]|nr:hypothetical protein [Pyrinomonadaceae bacterium]
MSRAETTSRGRLLKLTIVLAVLGPLLFSARARAQTNQPQPSARKFDEFGDIDLSAIKARLDNFAIALQHEPNVRGFIVVYRSRRDLEGLSHRLALRMKNYLLYNHTLAKERIVMVDGGAALCLTQELWVVDPGAAPKPREDAYSRDYWPSDMSRQFDEFHFPLLQDDVGYDDDINAEDSPDALEAFAAALREAPGSRACIIVYAQYRVQRDEDHDGSGRVTRARRRILRDPPGTARRILQTEKNYLTGTFGIAPSRVKLVDGGHRNVRAVELWVVPPGARAPGARPNAFPPRR